MDRELGGVLWLLKVEQLGCYIYVMAFLPEWMIVIVGTLMGVSSEPRTIHKVYHNGKCYQKSAPSMGAIYNDCSSQNVSRYL
jgi:hypothetical protein